MRGDGFQDDLAHLTGARCGRWLGGRWLLERVLGVGGTSAVYAATHRNGRRAAIKVLHPQWAMMPTIRRRFLREGYISNRVEHPAVAAVLDDGETDDGEAFLVLELLDGESLSAVLAQAGRLPVAQSIEIATRVLSVLEAAHARGIIHRDIKPDNLMVLRDGTVKVLDFGIASIKSADVTATLGTLPGGARGTPAYMAPEQARGQTVDGRTDLWALGAVLFRMLSGKPVREAPTAEAMLILAATQPAPPLQHVLPGAPPGLAALVDRALTFEPQGRFEDASAMLAALQAVGAAAPVSPGSSTLPEGSGAPISSATLPEDASPPAHPELPYTIPAFPLPALGSGPAPEARPSPVVAGTLPEVSGEPADAGVLTLRRDPGQRSSVSESGALVIAAPPASAVSGRRPWAVALLAASLAAGWLLLRPGSAPTGQPPAAPATAEATAQATAEATPPASSAPPTQPEHAPEPPTVALSADPAVALPRRSAGRALALAAPRPSAAPAAPVSAPASAARPDEPPPDPFRKRH